MMVGVIFEIGENKWSGIYMTIAHINYTVSYFHLSKVFAKKGGQIMSGEPVAYIGNTDRPIWEYLHLGGKYKGKAVNLNIL